MRVVKISDILDEVIPCTELPIVIINDLSCWRNNYATTIKNIRDQEDGYWIRLVDGKSGGVFSFDIAFVFNPKCYDDMYGYCLKRDSGNFIRYIPHYNRGVS